MSKLVHTRPFTSSSRPPPGLSAVFFSAAKDERSLPSCYRVVVDTSRWVSSLPLTIEAMVVPRHDPSDLSRSCSVLRSFREQFPQAVVPLLSMDLNNHAQPFAEIGGC